MNARPAPLTVTVVQAAPRARDIDANLSHVVGALESTPTDLLVYPELFLSGYQTRDLPGVGLTIEDPRLRSLASACAEHQTGLLVGFVEMTTAGAYDAYLAIDRDGRILPSIRKTHLFGDESTVFLRGASMEPIELCGVQLGVINCFEVEFPEVARTLTLRGAEILITGSANMHPYEADHRIATLARALENRVPLAYANRVGAESGHNFCGASRLIDANGHILGQLDTGESSVLTTTFSVGARPTPETDMLAQRLPELYA